MRELNQLRTFAGKPDFPSDFFKISVWLKMSRRKGVNKPRDINEKTVESTLKEK
jgi:hypothetical protein